MSLRIAASTVAFPGLPLLDLPERAAALALDGLALTAAERGSLHPNASEAQLRSFQARCRDLGISISALYGYAGRGMLGDAVARAADLDLARRCIDLAARLEAPVCRIFAWSGRPYTALIDRFVEACQPAAEHAAAAGIRLGFPTHHDLASDPASCRRLIEGFGRHRAGIIFNGQSLEIDGIAPIAACHKMFDIVIQAELKDWRHDGGHHSPTPIGQGEATVWPIVDALDASAFDGWLTLHHLKQHHPELPDLKRNVAEKIRAMAALRGFT
jgi:sugar phosphate isomerase/epimerase